MPDSFDELRGISDEWDRLAEASEFPNVFASWGFNCAWWRAFCGQRILKTAVVTDRSGKVRLIAPFYAPENDPASWRMIADFSGDYNDILVKAGDLESVRFFFSWLRRQTGWRELSIGRMPSAMVPNHFAFANHPDATPYEKLRSWLAIGSPLVYRAWNLEHPHCTGTALEQMRNLVSTKNYVRHVNWYRRNGDFVYRTIRDAKEIRALLPQFMDLHTKEWTAKGQEAQFKWALARQFFEYLTEEMAKYGTLRMNLLEFNGVMVAAHFGFQGQGRFYFYKPCLDPDHSRHSPGKVLMAYMLQQAVEEGLDDFDLLRGLDPYKDRYASEVRRTASLLIQRSRIETIVNRLKIKL